MNGDGRLADIEADRLLLKVGTLEVDIEAACCCGKVLLDGAPLPVRKMTLVLEAGCLARVDAELIPMSEGVKG